MSTTLSDAAVLYTDHGDGSADFTVSFADDDYKFSAVIEGDSALVNYEETLSWRGRIQVSEPDEDVYKALMVSDEMTEWMEYHGLDHIRREE